MLRYGIFAIGPAERQTDYTPEQFSFRAEGRKPREAPRTGFPRSNRPVRDCISPERSRIAAGSLVTRRAWDGSPFGLSLLVVDDVDRNSLGLEAVEIGLEGRVDLAELRIHGAHTGIVPVALEHEDAA